MLTEGANSDAQGGVSPPILDYCRPSAQLLEASQRMLARSGDWVIVYQVLQHRGPQLTLHPQKAPRVDSGGSKYPQPTLE